MSVWMSEESLLQWLEASALSTYIRQSVWLYPSVEIVHIAGFAVLVGSALLFDLRLLGLARKIPVTESIRHFLFWARAGFLLALLSGGILFMVSAESLASNAAFRIKMLLILLAGLNAAFFHFHTRKTVDSWDVNTPPPAKARAAGIVSILLWISVIACGRLIAYT